MPEAKLRAKTGCFTCRQRRIKCDETKPSCSNCARFGRYCSWPSASDMSDRRNRSERRGNAAQAHSPREISNDACESSSDMSPQHAAGCIVPVRSDFSTFYNMAQPLFRSDTEHELIHYFLNFYFRSLTLPTTNDAYFSQCLSELINMMRQSNTVKHAVLACCASNKYIMIQNNNYRLLALQYYSQAVKEMNQELETFRSDNTFQHSCLLTAVSFFYVFGFWGIDSTSDPRPHVDGAVKLLSLRSHDQATKSSTWCYDRVNVESVFYQGFLLATRRPFTPNFHLDAKFINHAEALLNLYGCSNSSCTNSSIVLGVPTSLYRLILRIMDSYNMTESSIQEYLGGLRVEMDHWEQLLLNKYDVKEPLLTVDYFNDLMILAASLLLDMVSEGVTDNTSLEQASDQKPLRWQVDLAMVILQCPEEYNKWSGCFLGAWPLLILGHGARTTDEIGLVKDVLSNIRQRTGYGEVQRIREELEEITQYKVISRMLN